MHMHNFMVHIFHVSVDICFIDTAGTEFKFAIINKL